MAVTTGMALNAFLLSPQRGSGVRRLAASLGVRIDGMNRAEASRIVASACRFDSEAGQHEHEAAQEERRILERDAARLKAISESTEAIEWSKTA